MDAILPNISLHFTLVAFAVAFFAGVIKGMVGFAMPMIMVSGLSSFLPPDLALAALILPTLVANWAQVLMYDLREAWPAIQRFRVFLIVGGVCLLISAQLVSVLRSDVMLIAIGLVVTAFALYLLSGRAPVPGSLRQNRFLDTATGAIAGLVGGISGIWGPPTVAYLTVIGTEKRVQMLAQGIIYGLGAVMLLVGHLGSGILNVKTLPFSAAMVVPAMAGVLIGARFSARFDQHVFRRVTLLVLTVGGLNLLRRGIMG